MDKRGGRVPPEAPEQEGVREPQPATAWQPERQPEPMPLWAQLFREMLEAKMDALKTHVMGELKASEARIIKWVVGTVMAVSVLYLSALGLLFAALQIWPPGG